MPGDRVAPLLLEGQIFDVLLATALVLSLALTAFFLLNKNSLLKRRVWRVSQLLSALFFIGIVVAAGYPPFVQLLVAVAVLPISYFNRHALQFCNACGVTVFRQGLLGSPEMCPKCGVPLQG